MTAPNNVDELIATAARGQEKGALADVIRALDSHEVFYRADVTPTEEGQRVTTPLVRLSDGSHAFVVYTSKVHPELPKKFGGAPWRHVLKMAAQLPQADWLIVSTAGGDWLPINKDQVNVIIQGLEGASPHGEAADVNRPVDAGGTDLDGLISRAQGSLHDDWSDPLLASLRNRELFVRISPDRLEDGRPVLVTSDIGDVRGLVQMYTSRVRSGMAYAGMSWQAIVDLVQNAAELAGVHIINDNDDWVVLGRSELHGPRRTPADDD